MERFVLDTSLFTNPEVYNQFGEDSLSAIRSFLELAKETDAEYYMPVSVYHELGTIKDLGAVAGSFEMIVRIRSPRRHLLNIPATFLYEFIEEVRGRIDRGLRIAEEHTRRGRDSSVEDDEGPLINSLRERYRDAMRRGVIDSREDVDCLLLAYELDGVLVSADQGLLKWADKVGVKLLSSRHMRHILENVVEHR